MSIAYRSQTSVAVGSRTNTTGSQPSGTTTDDVLVAFHSVGDAGDTTPPAVTGPTGWTLRETAIYGLTSDNYAVRLTMWTAPDTVSDWTWSHSSGSSTLWIGCFSGVDTSTPMDVAPSSTVTSFGVFTNGLTAAATSITTVTDDTLLVVGRGSWDGGAVSPPTGYTERIDNTLIWVGEDEDPTAGATGTVSVDSGNGSNSSPWGIILSALRPYTFVVPDAPSIPAGGYGYNNATWVPITAPADDGGQPITDYTIDYATAAAPTTWLGPFSDGGASTELFRFVTGLTVGVAYVFRVKATNSIGDSAWSATSASVTAADVAGFLDLESGDSILLESGDELLPEAGAAAGGPTSLVVADVTSGSTIDAVTLTQAHTLVVAASTAGSTVDALTLTQAHTLIVADSTSGSTIDALTITSATELVVNDSTSASTIDNVALTQAHTLVVADVTSSATIDGVTVTQAHTLVVADVTGASTIDALTLTQAHLLAVADSTAASTIDAITLSTGGDTALIVADVTGASTIDALTLTQAHTLAVADVASASTVDGVTITQAHTLTVIDSTGASTIDVVTLTQVHVLVVADVTSGSTIDAIVFSTPFAITGALRTVDLTDARTTVSSREEFVWLTVNGEPLLISGEQLTLGRPDIQRGTRDLTEARTTVSSRGEFVWLTVDGVLVTLDGEALTVASAATSFDDPHPQRGTTDMTDPRSTLEAFA